MAPPPGPAGTMQPAGQDAAQQPGHPNYQDHIKGAASRASLGDGGGGRHGRFGAWAADWKVGQVLAAWLAARVVVGAALGLARFLADTTAADTGSRFETTDLLGWDAGWYRTIAADGYAGAGAESRRFFPLLPLLTRAVAVLPVPGLSSHPGVALLVLANGAALAFAFALVRLARAEGFDDAATDRLTWLAAFAPPAFVLVMGYAEALAGLLAVLVFLGARTRRWELAAAAGLLAGLCRPLGLLLAVPVAIEAARGVRPPPGQLRPPDPGTDNTATDTGTTGTGTPTDTDTDTTVTATSTGTRPVRPGRRGGWLANARRRGTLPANVRLVGARPVGTGEVAGRAAAVVAPVAGAGIYLAWSVATFGDGFAPFTLQRDATRHGSTSNPMEVLADAARGTFSGELGSGLHVPWLLLGVAGLVVMARRLPASYTAWCGLVLAAVLTGSNLDSSERYLYGAFPFLLVAALVTGRRTVWPFVLACSAAAMTVYATLAFTLAYVP